MATKSKTFGEEHQKSPRIEKLRVAEQTPAGATQTRRDTLKEPAGLLTICPELRNRIYEEVLLVERRIEVTAALRMPALVSACRKIRVEAKAMWFLQNTLTVRIYDCDARLHEKWYEVRRTAGATGRGENFFTKWHATPHWPNLVQWCKSMYCVGRKRSYSRAKLHHGKRKAVPITAARLVAKGNFSDWKTCEKALQALRPLAGIIDPEWLDDHQED